jgi:hypothetical protein
MGFFDSFWILVEGGRSKAGIPLAKNSINENS